MTTADESAFLPTVLLPLAEAAPRLGLHPSALRSRIRRGLVTAKKGNDKRILVEVPANARPIHDETVASPEHDLAAEVDELRRELDVERLARVRAEGERDTAVATAAAKVEAAERLITELRKLLDDACRPWWQRWFNQGAGR
jgi:DNA-binding Lrp family transcriptional regulator